MLETIKFFLLGFIYLVISFVRALAAYILSLVMLLYINLGSDAFEKKNRQMPKNVSRIAADQMQNKHPDKAENLEIYQQDSFFSFHTFH
jgi:hypothetical protein